jgi:hypothetical protein
MKASSLRALQIGQNRNFKNNGMDFKVIAPGFLKIEFRPFSTGKDECSIKRRPDEI